MINKFFQGQRKLVLTVPYVLVTRICPSQTVRDQAEVVDRQYHFCLPQQSTNGYCFLPPVAHACAQLVLCLPQIFELFLSFFPPVGVHFPLLVIIAVK